MPIDDKIQIGHKWRCSRAAFYLYKIQYSTKGHPNLPGWNLTLDFFIRPSHWKIAKVPVRPGAVALTICDYQSLDGAKPIWIRRR